jgi:hypothetical protein
MLRTCVAAKPGEKTMNRRITGLAFFGLLCLAASASAGEGQVKLKLVKYDELKTLLADKKGKVVVIDFWSDT